MILHNIVLFMIQIKTIGNKNIIFHVTHTTYAKSDQSITANTAIVLDKATLASVIWKNVKWLTRKDQGSHKLLTKNSPKKHIYNNSFTAWFDQVSCICLLYYTLRLITIVTLGSKTFYIALRDFWCEFSRLTYSTFKVITYLLFGLPTSTAFATPFCKLQTATADSSECTRTPVESYVNLTFCVNMSVDSVSFLVFLCRLPLFYHSVYFIEHHSQKLTISCINFAKYVDKEWYHWRQTAVVAARQPACQEIPRSGLYTR